MRRTWTWRGAVIASMAVLAGSLTVGHTLAGGIAQAATAPTVERYNPYVSGNRLVFTQVQRAADGSTTAGVWARDLTTGAESLVADVATGEPMPVTSDTWTAWSDSPADGRVAVHARANRGGPILDLFATDQAQNPYTGAWEYTVPVSISGNELAAVNGTPVDPLVAELVRFTLPNPRASFVDVMSTASAPAGVAVAQRGATTVISEGNNVLFSVVDDSGSVVAAPSPEGADCFAGVGPDPTSVVFDGTRVGVFSWCLDPAVGYYASAIVTCTLPCRTVDVINLPALNSAYGYGMPRALALAGNRFFYVVNTPYEPGMPGSQIYAVDTAPGAVPSMVWSTSDDIGPRISADGNRLVWDASGYHDGTLVSELYQRDSASGTISILRSTGTTVVPAPAARLRHDPDISGRTVVYADRALDGSSAGIWSRSLNGRSTLLSTAASDTSVPRTKDEWTAWNTRDRAFNSERILATRGQGRSLVDVFSTNLANFTPNEFLPAMPAEVDLTDDGRAVVSASEDTELNYGQCCTYPTIRQRVYSRRLPDRALEPLGTLPSTQGFVTQQYDGRGQGRLTVATVFENYFSGASVRLYDRRNRETALSMPSTANPFTGQIACQPGPIDISSTDVVVATQCPADGSTWIASCDLPCTNGLANAIPMPTQTSPFEPGYSFSTPIDKLSASGSKVVVLTSTSWTAGRYGTRFGSARSLAVYDLARAQEPPITIPLQSGAVSTPRIDGNRVVFGVTHGTGASAIGELYLFDLRTRTLSAL